jgi:predicted PurR-regulated permease PerM
MHLDSAEQILVIIVSTVLTIFLVALIVLIIKLIQIIQHIKKLTEKAEQIADKAEAVTDFFERTAPSVAIGRLVSNIAESVFKKTKKRS